VADLMDAGSPGLTEELVNPVFFRMPLAPLAAGMLENRSFAMEPVLRAWQELSAAYADIIVEGCGGWEVPLTDQMTMADLAAALGLPVLVVVNNRLGALNHTILTVRAVQGRGLRCAGIILNYVADSRDTASISNTAVLRAVFPGVPVVAEVMHGETELDLSQLR
jgi:dethiobiotin synthetase